MSDDNGTPVLFESALFDVVDPVLSPGWVVIGVEECTLELGFPVFGAPGFWERYFDGDLGARRDYEEIGRWL